MIQKTPHLGMFYLKLVWSVCLLQEVKEERSNFICPLCNKNCMTQHQLTMHIRQVRILNTSLHVDLFTEPQQSDLTHNFVLKSLD